MVVVIQTSRTNLHYVVIQLGWVHEGSLDLSFHKWVKFGTGQSNLTKDLPGNVTCIMSDVYILFCPCLQLRYFLLAKNKKGQVTIIRRCVSPDPTTVPSSVPAACSQASSYMTTSLLQSEGPAGSLCKAFIDLDTSVNHLKRQDLLALTQTRPTQASSYYLLERHCCWCSSWVEN